MFVIAKKMTDEERSVIASVLPGPALLASGALAIAANEMIDLVPILIDETLHVLAARARLWAGIGNSTSESNVVANEVRACRIFQRILDVGLLHLEATVDITTVMRFVALRHLMMLHLVWYAGLCAVRRQELLFAQTAGPALSYRSTNKTRYRPPSQNPSGSVIRSRSAFTRPSRPTPSAKRVSWLESTRSRAWRSDGRASSVSR